MKATLLEMDEHNTEPFGQEPDPDWVFVDKLGVEHRWVDGLLPMIKTRPIYTEETCPHCHNCEQRLLRTEYYVPATDEEVYPKYRDTGVKTVYCTIESIGALEVSMHYEIRGMGVIVIEEEKGCIYSCKFVGELAMLSTGWPETIELEML